MRLTLAQINGTVGDLRGNTRKIIEYLERARGEGANLVAFPELAITGYPPEDLLLKPDFIRENLACLEEIARASRDLIAIVGFVDRAEDLYNAAAVLYDGRLAGVYHKQFLPNYGVFDEDRYYRAGTETPLFVIGGIAFGVSICEDIWYPTGPTALQAQAGARLLVNINASPYHRAKRLGRERMLGTRAADNDVIVAYVNLVGGQDELVFDGASAIFDQSGNLVARAKSFEEDLLVADVDLGAVFRARLHDPLLRKIPRPALPVLTLGPLPGPEPPASRTARVEPAPGPLEEVYRALVLGTRDYVGKNRFEAVVIGLSGGIDSSLVAAIAVDALGPQRVVGVWMPSRYSSQGSQDDARRLAENLGIRLLTLPIEGPFRAVLEALEPHFAGLQPNETEENIQARLRGLYLMALSNKFGWLVLTTGNKSEMATGYATLYGDMAGGFAVIKDVFKTLVFALCRDLNARAGREIIPESVLAKPPSAELRPNQKDVDSLPPYDVLDPILQAYVEEDVLPEELVARGAPPDAVERAVRLVERSEYKRRQAPPGVKITPRAFGRDRRLPITNAYRPASVEKGG